MNFQERLSERKVPTLYIMCGLGFSGKSTFAKRIANHFDIAVVSTDKMFGELQLEHDNYDQWLSLLRISKDRLSSNLKNGQSVVYDHPNVKLAERDELRDIARKTGARAVVVYLSTSDEEISQRQIRNKESKERHDPKQEHLDAVKRDFEAPIPAEGDVSIIKSDQDKEDFLRSQ